MYIYISELRIGKVASGKCISPRGQRLPVESFNARDGSNMYISKSEHHRLLQGSLSHLPTVEPMREKAHERPAQGFGPGVQGPASNVVKIPRIF